MIYLGCPYSHSDSQVRAWRVEQATIYAAKLANAGKLVYSPITHGFALVEVLPVLDRRINYWQRHSLKMLRACDSLNVLMLDGWDSLASFLTREIDAAQTLGMPVEYIQWEAIYAPRDQDPGHTLPR